MADVISLEDLAFLAMYHTIIDYLAEIPASHKREQFLSDDQPGLNPRAQANAFQKIRHQLDKKLSKLKSKEIRYRLLKYHNNGQKSKNLQLATFLDVILDESMDDITVSFGQDSQWNYEILDTIARRSPSVITLHLQWLETTQPHSTDIFISVMNQFNSLTSLNLHQLPDQCKSITFLLGRSCSNLKRLRIGFSKSALSDDELIRIFYSGNMADLEKAISVITVPETSSSSSSSHRRRVYHRCQVSPSVLHPFCWTLEEVHINRIDYENPYAIAFLLRHLPRLKQLHTSDFELKDFSPSIRALWDISDFQTPPNTLRCLDPHSSFPDGIAPLSILNSNPDLIFNTYFTGTLSLVNLFLEGEVEFRTLQSICDLCPDLNKLLLLESTIHAADKIDLDQSTQTELKKCFGQLKKLRTLACTESDGPLCSLITKATAPYLTTLEMALDGDFIPKFDFLTDCINLTVLKLSTEFHPPLKSYFNYSVKAATFLPKLEEVQLEFCMNAELEELFLQKSTLKQIDVLCFHHVGQGDDQLFQLFLQWPQLTCFKYKMPRKFTAEMWMKLLPHLPHLKLLSLYKDIKTRCSANYLLLKKACRSRHVQLELHLFLDTYLCIEGDINDELISTSDESETES